MLTDTGIKRAKIKDKNYKLYDSNGLFIEIRKTGKRYFRFRYKVGSKERVYTIGEYPIVSLKQARDEAIKLRRKIESGEDIAKPKKRESVKTFKEVSEEFFELKKDDLTDRHIMLQKNRLNNYANPLQNMMLKNISKNDIIKVIKNYKNVKTNNIKNTPKITTIRRVFGLIRQIIKFAVYNGYIDKNICDMIDINLLVPKEDKDVHLKAITDEKEIKVLFKAFDDLGSYRIVIDALKFLALTALRSGNIRLLRWEWIDFENKVIIYPKSAMKIKQEYRLPLTDTLINILKDRQKQNEILSSELVFPSPFNLSKPLSDNTLNVSHKRLGFNNHTAHGWRSAFSSICYEHQKDHGFSFEVIESQLSHLIGNTVTRAYMRTDFLDERRELLKWWEEFLSS